MSFVYLLKQKVIDVHFLETPSISRSIYLITEVFSVGLHCPNWCRQYGHLPDNLIVFMLNESYVETKY